MAAAREPIAVVRRDVDRIQAWLVGHHGSFDPIEQLVPRLWTGPDRGRPGA